MPAGPVGWFLWLNKCNMSLWRKVKACVMVKEEDDEKVMGTHNNADSACVLVRITEEFCVRVRVSPFRNSVLGIFNVIFQF